MRHLYKKVKDFYSYKDVKLHEKELVMLALQYDLGEITGKELTEKGVPLAKEEGYLKSFVDYLCELDIKEAMDVRDADPNTFFSHDNNFNAIPAHFAKDRNPFLRKRFLNVLRSGKWPDYYTEDKTLDALRDVFAEPDVQKVLNEETSTEKKLMLIKFLNRASKDSILVYLKERYKQEKEKERQEIETKIKLGSRFIELAPYLPKDDKYFEELFEKVLSKSHGTGRSDKAEMQRCLPFVDIKRVLANGFWSKATPMNRLALLAHPDLPDEYFVSSMKLLGNYFNNPKNRLMNIAIGRKMDWDDIRKLQTLGIGIEVFNRITHVENKGAPLTEAELAKWAFPEIVKMQKAVFERKMSAWVERLRNLKNPELQRLEKLNLSDLLTWHSLLQDADKPKATEIIKKVVPNPEQWAEVTKELEALEPNLLKLHFKDGVPVHIGPGEK